MYDRGKDHSSSNFSGYTDLPPGYRSLRMRELHKRKAEQRLKKLKESGRYQEITAKKELYWSVAFLPAIPVAVIGQYILVAVGSTMLLQVKNEDGNYVTLAEYTSDNLTELLNSIKETAPEVEVEKSIHELSTLISKGYSEAKLKNEILPKLGFALPVSVAKLGGAYQVFLELLYEKLKGKSFN